MTLFGKIQRRVMPYFSYISVDGMDFRNLRPTKSATHTVGYNKTHIIKIENQRNLRKLNSLQDEAVMIRYLNDSGCVTCPRLVSQGMLPSSEPYFIQERIHSKGSPNTADMLLALIEQKSFGLYQGDFKPENMVFDGNVCYLIDYDQAQRDDCFVQMNNTDFIEWIAKDFQERRGHDFFTDPNRNFNKQEMLGLFKDDSLNLGETAVLRNQKTTNTATGFYHQLENDKVYIDGVRDLSERKPILDKIVFNHGEKVLDVGCNLGLLAHYLSDRTCDVTGIDLDENIIAAATIVSNILGKDVEFRAIDIGDAVKLEHYDTVCLFSVLHHVQDMEQAIKSLSQNCNRIIMECKLHEVGSRPTSLGWKRTNKWKFENIEGLVAFLESQFVNFKLEENYGLVDRNRYILSFIKPPEYKEARLEKLTALQS